MRVIDQCGCIDLNYDNATLCIDDGNIIAYIPSSPNNALCLLMAEYSDIDTANKAMKQLQIQYHQLMTDSVIAIAGNSTQYFKFPPKEHL